MFSGIVETLGEVVSVVPRGNGRTLVIRSPLPVAAAGEAGVGRPDRERIGLGDSIACNGVCLTVEEVAPPDCFTVAAAAETIAATTMGRLKAGDRLHLERALRMGDRLDGHLVAGHVDGLGTVHAVRRQRESVVIEVDAPPGLARYLARKGSVTIDGVSLTINRVERGRFRVSVVPYTADETRLGSLTSGAVVNLEVDLIARYVERLLESESSAGRLDAARMRALGYGRSPP
ncbi:MAG: riboflavin synthase [Myxococcota bacterium]|nr:riboflavin synthase [Myxococcota bacterium]MEC8425403.1 riboflavin synthase [Myxococcota bacterium]